MTTQPKYTIDNLPAKIEIVRYVEIYAPGCVITYSDGMYRYPGAVFGISRERGLRALNEGHAKPYLAHPTTG